MEYLYAALLLHKAGQEIKEDTLKKTLASAGVKADDAKVKATVTALKDVDIDKVLAETTIASAPAAAPSASEGDSKKEDEKKEEKKEEDSGASEEEAAAGLGALFG